MKLRDIGATATREWFQQILEWSRRRVSFADNIDGTFITVDIGTDETEVGHSLGRAPQYAFEVARFGSSTAGITLTRPPEATKIFVRRTTTGTCTLFLI